MLPCSRIDVERSQVYLKDFANNPLDCVEAIPEGSSEKYVSWSISDGEKTYQVQLKERDLQALGISVTALEHLRNNQTELEGLLSNTARCDQLLERIGPLIRSDYTYAKFFQNPKYRAWINRAINSSIVAGTSRTEKAPGRPRVYLARGEIFVSLKGLDPLGNGAYAKVKQSAWITGPLDQWRVAKKKFSKREDIDLEVHAKELAAYKMFQNKVGIINLIAGGDYGGKLAMFFPIYDCNLWTWLTKSPFPLNIDETLTVFSHWLQGLATIAESGVHQDLSLKNLLINQQGPEGAICDLGAFRFFGEEELDLTTPTSCSPEYFEGTINTKLDVWGMGLALQTMVVKRYIPLWGAKTKAQIKDWILPLRPNWSLSYPVKVGTPQFLVFLINDMLHPDSEMRLSAAGVLERFSEGKAAYYEQQNKQKKGTV